MKEVNHSSGKEILLNRVETEKELEEKILEHERQLLGLKLRMVLRFKDWKMNELNKE